MDFTALIDHYGYIILFIALMLEILALPLPGEILMSYAGFLVFQGRLNWMIAIGFSAAGSIMGITLAYRLGLKLGVPFFDRYGARFHMGSEKLEKVTRWFSRYGNKLLILAYFVPGFRHITGYFSGVTQIPYRTFAANAYIGAFLWVSTFIFLGKTLGPQWQQFQKLISHYLIIAALIAAAILIFGYLFTYYKLQIKEFILRLRDQGKSAFNSSRKIGFLMITAAVSFIGLFALMIGLIQDYLFNEFAQFNTVVMLLIHLIFPQKWFSIMQFFSQMVTVKVLLAVSLLTMILISLSKRNRRLEATVLMSAVMGGEVLGKGLSFLFQHLGPAQFSWGSLAHAFPSEQSFLAVVIYGFTAFILIRYFKNIWMRMAVILAVLTIVFFTGVSHLFLKMQYPSDIVAGYVFGGVWLSLLIMFLEISYLLPRTNTKN